MSKTLHILCITKLVEPVHVKLADEGAEIVVLETLRKHFLGEVVGVPHDKAVACLIPMNRVFIFLVIHNIVSLC